MQKETYLQQSVKNDILMRWSKMPLKVYVAPMRFYSKQGQDLHYRAIVNRALDEWHKVSNGKVSFILVDSIYDSQINIDWKRVERQALGCCKFEYYKNLVLMSADVSIGLTDGLVHADYMDEGEVYHTILHEIGHAIGLGHSPFKTDIMYTPHQQGIIHLGKGDKLSINWLYTFKPAKSVHEIASQYKTSGSDIDEIIARIIHKDIKTEFEQIIDNVNIKEGRNLLNESENIANLKKYNLSLQNITISNDLTEKIRKHYRDNNKR